MRVVSILNSKGGVGKSTLSCHLARAFQLLPARVLLLDTDTDQLSSQSWGGIQTDGLELPAVAAQGNLRSYVRSIRSAFDYVIVDGAAKLERQDVQAIAVSDLVLVPVLPSLFDVWPLERLVDQVRQRRELTGDDHPKAAFVVANHNPRVKESVELETVFAEYPEFPLLSSTVPDRIIYSRSLDAGSSVFDYVTDSPSEERAMEQAQKEITALRGEIMELL